MILSMEEMLKQKNLTSFSTVTPDVVDMLRNEILNPQKMLDEAENLVNDKFYDLEAIAEKYNLHNREFEYLVSVNRNNLVNENNEHRNKIEQLFYEQFEKHGEKLYEDIGKLLTGNYLVSDYDASVADAMCNLITKNGDLKLLQKKYIDLEFDMAKEAVDYFKEKERYMLFDQYKKEVLDKLPSTSAKLDALVKFMYIQEGLAKGRIEKKAVDYYLEKSGFLETANIKYTAKELEAAEKEAEKWLAKHNKPVNFLDLAQTSSKGYFSLLYKIAKMLGFCYFSFRFDKQFDVIDSNILRHIFALLNKFPELYKNNKDLKEFTIYLCFMLWPIIQHGRSYTITAIGAELLYEKLVHEKDKEINELKKEVKKISVLEEHLNAKQESLNKLQLDYDRLKNKELAKLKEELEEQKRLLKEQIERNKYLEEMNTVLESQLEEMDTIAATSSSISDDKPTSYIENRLKSMNIVIMGGHKIWQNRLKEIYPYFTYIDSDNVNYDINITRNADIIFFNTLHCSHTLFYRIKNNVNSGRTNNKEKLIFIGSNNLSQFKEIVSKTITGTKK